MKDFSPPIFPEHSLDQMDRRGVSQDQERAVSAQLDKITFIRECRIAQKIVSEGSSSRQYMLRVFLDADREPPVVVTAYRAGILEKY